MPVPDRIIRLRTVLDRTGLSRSTLYRKIAEGTFPPRNSASPSTARDGGSRKSIGGSPIRCAGGTERKRGDRGFG
jgi:hypothetical protein